MTSVQSIPPRLGTLIRLTRLIPPLPHASALSNRALKKLWAPPTPSSHVFPVWPGIRMILDPADCVGGNLAFIPHLYDRWERAAIARHLPAGGVFVDVGSNVGAYALWAARHAGTGGTVVAIEAEPENYRTLVENIRLNGFGDSIIALEAGVSDQESILTLSCNRTGNRGAHSFSRVSPAGVPVRCTTLDRLLEEAGIDHVDFMKMDIEGFELRVLSAFFRNVPPTSPLRARFLLVEIDGGPSPEGEKQTLIRLLADEGYRVLRRGSNWLFERR